MLSKREQVFLVFAGAAAFAFGLLTAEWVLVVVK
jgi:hypothetical protein